ncbi:MAG: glycosyl transferase GT17 family protein [Lachnospiraceae bacterium]|nr:glycosyl transferase GT17 family protein [Lachnospiraceae bacterium]
MIYDCFPFFNELDILKMRMEIMDPIVDKFVIEEAAYTFSSEPKPLYFQENKQLFKKWEDKIIHIVVDECPVGIEPHDMDHFQKDHLLKGLEQCKEDDICIFSDVDEIPNPDTLVELFPKMEQGKIYHLAQRMFYCFLNAEEVSGKLLSYSGEFEGVERPMWLGTKVFHYGTLRGRGFWDLRTKEAKINGVRVPNGGWHFGYMGGNGERDLAKRIGDKVVAAAHQEYNSEEILMQVTDRIMTGQDIFGRDAKFECVEIDDTYPKYLLEHIDEYDFLIMPRLTPAQMKMTKIKMKVKRVGRRLKRGMKRLLGRK